MKCDLEMKYILSTPYSFFHQMRIERGRREGKRGEERGRGRGMGLD